MLSLLLDPDALVAQIIDALQSRQGKLNGSSRDKDEGLEYYPSELDW